MLKESKMRWQFDIANKKALLLGELPVSNEEYSWLKTYFINYIVKSDNAPVTVDLAIALFLVQVAIREYTEGKYWDNLERTLDCVVPQARRTKANDIFYKTLVFYDLFVFPSKNGKMQYTEMIKAHAFVTNNYMSGFFDFINAYFETVLFRQLNKKDVSEDLAALSAYMKETLEDGDSISIKSKNDKVPKTYRLLNPLVLSLLMLTMKYLRDCFTRFLNVLIITIMMPFCQTELTTDLMKHLLIGANYRNRLGKATKKCILDM